MVVVLVLLVLRGNAGQCGKWEINLESIVGGGGGRRTNDNHRKRKTKLYTTKRVVRVVQVVGNEVGMRWE